VWCETGKPDLEFARKFAEAIHAKFPGKLLAYNCSPSFNWKKNLDDATIAKFQKEIASYGYKFQFITLAGFHALNYGMFDLAHGYARRQMSAFVELQEEGVRRRRPWLHRGQAPARGRHRLLRCDHPDHPGRQVLDRGAEGLAPRKSSSTASAPPPDVVRVPPACAPAGIRRFASAVCDFYVPGQAGPVPACVRPMEARCILVGSSVSGDVGGGKRVGAGAG
jgi:hypothetical protein